MEAEMKTAIRHSAQRTRQQGGFVVVGILVVLAALGGGHLLMMRRPPYPQRVSEHIQNLETLHRSEIRSAF